MGLIVFLALAIVLGLALAVARWYFSGPRLARFLTDILFSNARGCVTVESIDWPFLGIAGRNLEGTLHELRVYAPLAPGETGGPTVNARCGRLVLEVKKAVAVIDWPTVVFGRHDVIIQHITLEDGFALVKEVPAPATRPGDRPTEVGFIAAFQGRPRPGEAPSVGPSSGPIILLKEMDLANVEVHLEFDKWNAHLYGVQASGVLRQSFRNLESIRLCPPVCLDFTYALEVRAERGSVEFAGQHFDVRDLVANRFGQYPSDPFSLQFAARAATVEGAQVMLYGRLKDLYDPDSWKSSVDLHVDVTQGGALLSRVSLGYLAGERAAGSIEIHGPMPAPQLTAEGRALEIAGAIPATIDHVAGAMDIESTQIEVAEAEIAALSGRAEAKGRYNLLANVISSATIAIAEPMNVAPLLPAEILRDAGSRLSGVVSFSAVPPAWTAHSLHATLGRLTANGSVRMIGDPVATPGLALRLEPDVDARVAGHFSPQAGGVDLAFRLRAGDLAPHLERLGLPPLARSLEVLAGRVTGTLRAPTIAARVTALGAPLTPRVDAELTYHHAPAGGRLDVRRLAANPLGGTLAASGAMTLGARPQLTDVRAEAHRLDLSRLPGIGARLAGTVDIAALRASGPLRSPRGSLGASAAGLAFDGHPIGDARIAAHGDERGVTLDELRVGGGANGSLEVRGLIGAPSARGRPLDLSLGARGLRLAMVPQKTAPGARPLDLDGRVGAELRVRGTSTRPTAEGSLSLDGLSVYGSALGGGTLTLRPDGSRVRFTGSLFQDRIGVDGTVALGGPIGIDAEARLRLDQLELEQLFYEVADRVGAHAWVSGAIDVRTAPSLSAEAHLDRVRFDFEGTDAAGKPNPITVENRGELALRGDLARRELQLLVPLTMVSSTGDFTLSGMASEDRIDARLAGDVQLRLLELFTRRFISKASGNLKVNLVAGGSLARPVLDGTVAFQDAAVTPREQDAELRIPGGRLVLSLDRVRAEAVALEVDGERMTLDGTVQLKALRPNTVDARLSGRLPGRLLQMLAPEQISLATGSAAIGLSLKGPFDAPAVVGEIDVDRPLEIAPRALRRELIVRAGRIRWNNQRVEIDRADPLTGELDEGRFAVRGGAWLKPQLRILAHIDLDGITQRVPGVLELELAAGVDVEYRDQSLSVSGALDVVDGRYVQKLELDRYATRFFVPARTAEVSEPFWKGSPLLADMQLDLEIRTKGKGTFAVSNELAELTLDGSLTLSGTPSRPVFDGQVSSVGEGKLMFPGTKIREFAVSYGQVSFSPYARFPDRTPTVAVRAEAPFVDYSGTEHRVYLEITGPLSAIEWKLYTSTGLNQAQTLTLISTGRTPEELLGRTRGDAATASSAADFGANAAQASSVGSFYDEAVKTFTGDIIDTLVADAVRNILGLDCFSLSVGGSSVRASACKKLGQLVLLTGEYEQGLLGQYRYQAGASARPTDDISLVLQLWGLRSAQEIEGVQNELRLQLEYRFTLR